jgi:hypothetical protein
MDGAVSKSYTGGRHQFSQACPEPSDTIYRSVMRCEVSKWGKECFGTKWSPKSDDVTGRTIEPASLNCAWYFEQDTKIPCLQDSAGLNDNKNGSLTDQFASEMLSTRPASTEYFFSLMKQLLMCIWLDWVKSLWLWRGDSSGAQERERPPLEADTRGLVKERRPSACVVKCIQTVKYR